MKIKTDFVTNSSSTGFFFLFNDDKENLIKSLHKKKSKFDFHNCPRPEWCEKLDPPTFQSLIGLITDETIESKDVTELFIEISKQIKYLKEYLNEKDIYSQSKQWARKEIKELEKKLNLIEKKGFNKYIELDCGNDGELHSYFAQCIRCNFPRIFISKDVLLVTEERS